MPVSHSLSRSYYILHSTKLINRQNSGNFNFQKSDLTRNLRHKKQVEGVWQIDQNIHFQYQK
jgi:hypothetical protein